ncbi:hypothetical protein GCM10027589_21330 [Actinocorallia lasiicapitis]
MRRIAAVTMTAALVAGGVGLASPASAAPAPAAAKATHKWQTFNGKKGSIWRTIRVNGTYTRSGGSVTLRGWLHDTKRNGWSPGVQFRSWGDGQWHYSSAYFAKYASTGKPVDRYFNYNYGYFWSSSYDDHLQVREVAINAKNKKKSKNSSWKKLY